MIYFDDRSDPKKIYDMWQRNFHDPAAYADFYFSQVYGENEVLLNAEEESGILKGMVHLNPYMLMMAGKKMEAHYIVGVSTDEEYRRQGVMRQLLTETFATLRERGEAFTYLMPADEDYYLPFDFRFGMSRIEQEVYILSTTKDTGASWTFTDNPDPEMRKECSDKENALKESRFDLFTLVSPEYLVCLEKETKSDYGYMYYVFDGEDYLGRFTVSPEYECLIVSRIFAVSDQKAFLEGILHFLEKKFSYKNYQVILDPSYGSLADKAASGPRGKDVRILPAKHVPKIMFRILSLEKMAEYLTADGDGSCIIEIRDHYIPDNEGCYLFECSHGRVRIEKTGTDGHRKEGAEVSEESEVSEEFMDQSGNIEPGAGGPEGGRIGIADLTARLFGTIDDDRLRDLPGLTEAGIDCLKKIRPAADICIMEIV